MPAENCPSNARTTRSVVTGNNASPNRVITLAKTIPNLPQRQTPWRWIEETDRNVRNDRSGTSSGRDILAKVNTDASTPVANMKSRVQKLSSVRGGSGGHPTDFSRTETNRWMGYWCCKRIRVASSRTRFSWRFPGRFLSIHCTASRKSFSASSLVPSCRPQSVIARNKPS